MAISIISLSHFLLQMAAFLSDCQMASTPQSNWLPSLAGNQPADLSCYHHHDRFRHVQVSVFSLVCVVDCRYYLPRKFSRCSVDEYVQFLLQGGGSCLFNKPNKVRDACRCCITSQHQSASDQLISFWLRLSCQFHFCQSVWHI